MRLEHLLGHGWKHEAACGAAADDEREGHAAFGVAEVAGCDGYAGYERYAAADANDEGLAEEYRPVLLAEAKAEDAQGVDHAAGGENESEVACIGGPTAQCAQAED